MATALLTGPARERDKIGFVRRLSGGVAGIAASRAGCFVVEQAFKAVVREEEGFFASIVPVISLNMHT